VHSCWLGATRTQGLLNTRRFSSRLPELLSIFGTEEPLTFVRAAARGSLLLGMLRQRLRQLGQWHFASKGGGFYTANKMPASDHPFFFQGCRQILRERTIYEWVFLFLSESTGPPQSSDDAWRVICMHGNHEVVFLYSSRGYNGLPCVPGFN